MRCSIDGGFSLIEILVTAAIVSFCLVPIVGLYSQQGPASPITEDGIYAELLATRILERASALPWAELENLDGRKNETIVKDVFQGDKREDWYIIFKEYRHKLQVGREYFRGHFSVRKLADGLLAMEIVIRWTPPGPVSKTEQFSLFRLRTRNDLSLRSVPELTL